MALAAAVGQGPRWRCGHWPFRGPQPAASAGTRAFTALTPPALPAAPLPLKTGEGRTSDLYDYKDLDGETKVRSLSKTSAASLGRSKLRMRTVRQPRSAGGAAAGVRTEKCRSPGS